MEFFIISVYLSDVLVSLLRYIAVWNMFGK